MIYQWPCTIEKRSIRAWHLAQPDTVSCKIPCDPLNSDHENILPFALLEPVVCKFFFSHNNFSHSTHYRRRVRDQPCRGGQHLFLFILRLYHYLAPVWSAIPPHWLQTLYRIGFFNFDDVSVFSKILNNLRFLCCRLSMYRARSRHILTQRHSPHNGSFRA